MARKQSEYLADILGDDDEAETATPSPAPAAEAPATRTRPSRGSMTLLGRESALARVASGEVKQVTQVLLDPARVRPWPGNARSYAHLTEENCRELIDALVAEGGQKVPAVVRRIEGVDGFDYEVIAGTRRHWAISWLRANSYPDMKFLAQVADLDDEAAFRLADIENRARKDVSDLERARNYASALKTHYGNHLTRMAERLKLSKGWLSKMIKVAGLPDAVIDAFASPADVQLKPAYPLAQAMDDTTRAKAIRAEAKIIAKEQLAASSRRAPTMPATEVLKRLMAAGTESKTPREVKICKGGRALVTVQSSNRQGVTLRLHSGTGASHADVLDAVKAALHELEAEGRGLTA